MASINEKQSVSRHTIRLDKGDPTPERWVPTDLAAVQGLAPISVNLKHLWHKMLATRLIRPPHLVATSGRPALKLTPIWGHPLATRRAKAIRRSPAVRRRNRTTP